MGLESYNFLIFPDGNSIELTEDGWEIKGEEYISFSKAKETFLCMDYINCNEVKNYSLNDNTNCNYIYNDKESIIEFQLNAGDYAEKFQEISARFAVCNPIGTYEKAIKILEKLSIELNLNVLDMRLGEILDFSNENIIKRSRNTFEQKKKEFFSFFKLPYGAISEPLLCGNQVFDRLKQGNKSK